MKLTIKKGESVESAIQYLTDFLNEYKEEYPILKGDMSVYVTLRGNDNRICPENEKEFILSEEYAVDVEGSRYAAAKENLLRMWKHTISNAARKVQVAQGKIDTDIRYLETAEEKGRKPENIVKRKTQLESNQMALRQAKEAYQWYQKLDTYVQENKVCWYYLKSVSSRSSYQYTLTAHIVFENIDGFTGYFICGNGYSNMREGLPQGYKGNQ